MRAEQRFPSNGTLSRQHQKRPSAGVELADWTEDRSFFAMDLARAVVIAAIVCAACRTPSAAAQSTGPLAVRIACGATVDTVANETGFLWSHDFGYSGGRPGALTETSRIAAQLNTVRFFDAVDGPESCYNITVPSGHYLTRFFLPFQEAGNIRPIFGVSLEGTLVYSFDPGWSVSVDSEYEDSMLHITDGAATICFHSSSHGSPVVASIEINQLYIDAYNIGENANLNVVMRTIKRVSAGAAASGYGSRMKADVWGGDRYWATDQALFAPGSAVDVLRTNASIVGFGNPPNIYPEAIYQSATTTGPLNSLSYTVPVQPNQTYSLWLHFAEIQPGVAAGMRVFDVMVNDKLLFPGVDVVGTAGAPFTALILNKTVTADSGTLTLSFYPRIGSVAVNAFEMFQIIPREYATFDETVWALQNIKRTLELPSRLGWNGDPCVPQMHPWYGTACAFDNVVGAWFVSNLALDLQGIGGQLDDSWVALRQLQTLNLSNNLFGGAIPSSFGNMTSLTTLDLSHNRLNGSIPASLAQLSNLKALLLNDNSLSGEVPPALGALPVRGAILNVGNNPDLCGVGIGPCSRFTTAQKIGIAFGVLVGLIVLGAGGVFCWKKLRSIGRGAQRLPREAPYAKARTMFVRDVQMARTAIQNHFSRPPPAYQAALNPY